MAQTRTTTSKRRSGGLSPAVKYALATVSGGAIGAVAGHLIRDFKVSAMTTGLAVTGAGLIGTAATSGTTRWFCAGIATSGASQTATQLSATYLKRQGLPPSMLQSMLDITPIGPRNLPAPPNSVGIVEAIEEAERELASVVPY